MLREYFVPCPLCNHFQILVFSDGADGGLVPIVTESRNISGSGVYCLSPNYLAPLSKVALTIVLPAVAGAFLAVNVARQLRHADMRQHILNAAQCRQ